MTPSQLHSAIRTIIAQETGCNVTWEQHPQELAGEEVYRILTKIVDFIAPIVLANLGEKKAGSCAENGGSVEA